jgi:predicted nucleic acid-binding protein
MAKATVYIETSVLSYLAARPSRDVLTLAQQQVTAEWWEKSRAQYGLSVSTVVVEEAASGNAEAAQRRLSLLADVEILEVNDPAIRLAAQLVDKKAIPPKAAQDALHIAVACVNQVEYLLTWNYKHIANATMREAINRVCREAGYDPPVICTPAELGGNDVG